MRCLTLSSAPWLCKFAAPAWCGAPAACSVEMLPYVSCFRARLRRRTRPQSCSMRGTASGGSAVLARRCQSFVVNLMYEIRQELSGLGLMP